MYIQTNISIDPEGHVQAGFPSLFATEKEAIENAKTKMAEDFNITKGEVESEAQESGTPYILSLSRNGRREVYTVVHCDTDVNSIDLIRKLPAMLQGRRKFASFSEGGNYHQGPVDDWCLTFKDIVVAIEDYCEYKHTGKYTLSAPVNGCWDVLNAYSYEGCKDC